MILTFDPPPKGAIYRIRNIETGLYLLGPITGNSTDVPQWERIPECCARFTKAQAQDQKNYLGWYPHRMRTEITTDTAMRERT